MAGPLISTNPFSQRRRGFGGEVKSSGGNTGSGNGPLISTRPPVRPARPTAVANTQNVPFYNKIDPRTGTSSGVISSPAAKVSNISNAPAEKIDPRLNKGNVPKSGFSRMIGNL